MVSPDGEFNAPIIGLAGGIGAGKSEVASILASLGCVVAKSDEDARAVLQEPEVRSRLIEWWGDGILDETGAVDRKAVADRVFDRPDERRRLEELVHPRVERRRSKSWAKESATRRVPAFVIDAPLLFEAGLDRQCDLVIFVDVDRETRLRRLEESRGWTEPELIRREKNQWPLDMKRKRADYLVENRGDRETLRREIEAVFRRILRDPPRG